MANLIRKPLVKARSRFYDSSLWNDYRPRPDDIIIAKYPKCGTTWMQRIVGMLIFQSDAPFPVQESAPWPDIRIARPDMWIGLAESQTHRRFLKTHLPYDSLPIYEGVKIIHVGRDGRDAAMSFHNHKFNFTDDFIAAVTQISLADPKFGTPYQATDADPAQHFHEWVTGEADHMGDLACGFWHLENSYWDARSEPNVLLVHYADLKAALDDEMRRIADFLEIEVSESLWPKLVEAASFESMKSKADELLPSASHVWHGGADTFMHKGTNGRWREVFHQDDLALYDAKVEEAFSPELAHWIEFGRLG